MKFCVYLAHPVTPTFDHPKSPRFELYENIGNVKHWLKWLVDNTDWAVSVPWLPYVETLPESKYRERGLLDDLAMLETHHGLVLVGGSISTGMRMELDHARSLDIPVLDLTPSGRNTPTEIETFIFKKATVPPFEEVMHAYRARS